MHGVRPSVGVRVVSIKDTARIDPRKQASCKFLRTQNSPQPAGQFAGRRQLDHRHVADLRVSLHCVHRGLRRRAVEVEDADRLAAGVCRPTVIWAMLTWCFPKIVPMKPIMPGHVAVGEDEQHAVEVGLEPVRPELHQAEVLVAEERAGRDVVPCSVSTSAWRSVAKSPFLGLDDSTISMPRSRASTSALTRLTSALRRNSSSPAVNAAVSSRVFLPGEVALVGERRLADRAVCDLRVQQTEPPGEIDVRPHLVEFGPVDRGHVDGVGDLPLQEEVGDELRRLDRDVLLRLDRRCAEVRRQDDVGSFEQRVVGRRSARR